MKLIPKKSKLFFSSNFAITDLFYIMHSKARWLLLKLLWEDGEKKVRESGVNPEEERMPASETSNGLCAMWARTTLHWTARMSFSVWREQHSTALYISCLLRLRVNAIALNDAICNGESRWWFSAVDDWCSISVYMRSIYILDWD